MQHRMKEFTMEPQAIEELLYKSPVGRLGTTGTDGYPYVVSVHYYYDGDAIYFHGLPQGEKTDNMKADNRVCFEVSQLKSILKPVDEKDICTADAEYESVVIRGKAHFLNDVEEKKAILKKIVEKFLPGADNPMPEKMIAMTAVVKIEIERKTGKYHK